MPDKHKKSFPVSPASTSDRKRERKRSQVHCRHSPRAAQTAQQRQHRQRDHRRRSTGNSKELQRTTPALTHSHASTADEAHPMAQPQPSTFQGNAHTAAISLYPAAPWHSITHYLSSSPGGPLPENRNQENPSAGSIPRLPIPEKHRRRECRQKAPAQKGRAQKRQTRGASHEKPATEEADTGRHSQKESSPAVSSAKLLSPAVFSDPGFPRSFKNRPMCLSDLPSANAPT